MIKKSEISPEELARCTKLLESVLANKPPVPAGFQWNEVLRAVSLVSGGPALKSQNLLLDILGMQEDIPLASDSDIPHALCPRDMLKSMAMQALPLYSAKIQSKNTMTLSGHLIYSKILLLVY